MKTMPIERAKELRIAELLEMLSGEDAIILTEGGEGRFVIGAMDELEWEAFALSQNKEFMAYLDACRARGNREGSIPLDDVRQKLVTDV